MTAALHGFNEVIDRQVRELRQVRDLDPADGGCRPERDKAVAMLPDDTCVHLADVDMEVGRDKSFQAH